MMMMMSERFFTDLKQTASNLQKLAILYGSVSARDNRVFSRVHATLHPALSVRPSVGRSVGLLVRHTFTFFLPILFL